MDCELLGVDRPQKASLPFRHRFLVQNEIIEDDSELLTSLDRKKIDGYLRKWNEDKLKRGDKLGELNFCSEDEEEDNDTDEEFQYEKAREFEMCQKNEKEMMEQFVK